jgi:amino acid transporter
VEEPLGRGGVGPATVVGAALVTVFFPFFALVFALLFLRGETDPDRRAFYRKWAWWSAAWLAAFILLILLASVRLS